MTTALRKELERAAELVALDCSRPDHLLGVRLVGGEAPGGSLVVWLSCGDWEIGTHCRATKAGVSTALSELLVTHERQHRGVV